MQINPEQKEALKSMTFIMACNTFFGKKPGQTLMEFNSELKALTPKDRAEMVEMFKTVGIDATKVMATA